MLNQPSSTAISTTSAPRHASTLTILPAQPEDYIRISDLKTAAFKGSLIDTALFPSISAEARRPHAVLNFAYALRNPQTRLIKAVNQDGEIVGEAQYSVPLREGEEAFEPPKEERPAWPEGTDLAEIEALFSKAGFKEVKEPKICALFPVRSSSSAANALPLALADLASFATDPAFGRTGAGRAMLKFITDEADKDGLDIYLESSPGALLLFSSPLRIPF